MQAFSPVELRLRLVKNAAEIDSLAKSEKISILVTGQTLSDKGKYDGELTVMKPLVAYSKKQIKEQLEWFMGLV